MIRKIFDPSNYIKYPESIYTADISSYYNIGYLGECWLLTKQTIKRVFSWSGTNRQFIVNVIIAIAALIALLK